MPNPKSTASIAGHPIHPMLVGFPIAFFVATFASELIFWQTGVPFWAAASFWLLGAGLVMAALAAVAGLIDFLGEAGIRALNHAWWHAGGNVLAVLIQLFNWFLRGHRSYRTVTFARRYLHFALHRLERLEPRLSSSCGSFRRARPRNQNTRARCRP